MSNAANLAMFVPISKIDEEKRLIYGTMTAAVPDRANETLDYERSKPHFQKWSGEVEKASGGKSKGNLRAMHKQISAGKLVDISFDDAGKKIDYCAKVVDDNEWQKVLEGVYTGVSIGGKYESRTPDPVAKTTRFVAIPGELSLVDIPCLPSATFEVMKADGSVMQKNFQPWTPDNADVAKKASELAKEAGDPSTWTTFLDAAREALITERLEAATVTEDDVAKAAPARDDSAGPNDTVIEPPAPAEPTPAELGLVQKWETPDGAQFLSKADAARHVMTLDTVNPVAAALARAHSAMAKGADGLPPVLQPDDLPYGDVEYADPGLLKDGVPRFPIDTAFNVRASWGHFCKNADAMGYDEDDLSKVAEAIGYAWGEVIGNAPPSFEQMQTVADIGLFSDALEVLGKRSYLNDAKTSPYMSEIMACGPSASNGLGIIRQLASMTADSVRIANNLAEIKDDEDDPTLRHARDVVAANATLLAEATHAEVAQILDEVDEMIGEVPESMEGMDDAIKLADTLVDLVKSDEDTMNALDDAAMSREEEYVAKWLDVIGSPPPAIEPETDGAYDAFDLAVFSGGLFKMAECVPVPFLSSGLTHVAAVAGQVANFTNLVNTIEKGCVERGETTESCVLARDILKSLGDFLVVCAHEEVGELQDDIDLSSVEANYDVDDIEGAYFKAAQTMVDLAKGDPDIMEKRGARHSKADLAAVQSIHDYAEKLGARCGIEKVDGEGDLAKGGDLLAKVEKMAADNADLRKQVADAVSGIDNLTKQAVTLNQTISDQRKEIDELRDTPAPIVPARTHTVSKQDEKQTQSTGGDMSEDEIKAAIEKMSPAEKGLLLIKLSQSSPMAMTKHGLST